MRVWLDCEFTSIENPELLSVALVADDGRELYVELLNDKLLRRCSDFVHDIVLPMFGLVDGARARDYMELCHRLEVFVLSLGSQIELLYDYKADRDLVEQSLSRATSWAKLSPRLSWRNVDLETSSDAAQDAMEATFTSSLDLGLGRHHALVDARALRMAHLAGGCE